MPATSYSLAHARAPLDGGNEVEEGQHGPLPQASMGLARLDLPIRYTPFGHHILSSLTVIRRLVFSFMVTLGYMLRIRLGLVTVWIFFFGHTAVENSISGKLATRRTG
jgi:hypothetical protein